MTLRDAIILSLDNLRQARLRTALTSLGVAIGVGSIVGMLAVAVGLQDNLYGYLLKAGFFRRITVFPQMQRDQQPARLLDEAALDSFRKIDGVKTVNMEVRLPIRAENGGKTFTGSLQAVTPDDADEAVFQDIQQGSFFTSETAQEIILNSQTLQALGYSTAKEAVGKKLKISVSPPGRFAFTGFGPPGTIPMPDPIELQVVGVVERERAVFGDPVSRQVFVPYKLAEQQLQFFRKNAPMVAAMVFSNAPVHVRLHDARNVDRVEQQIRKQGFRTISISSIITGMRKAFLVVDMLLAVIGSMALAVASLGIVNTMVMAVLERTREIGVMKAVGAEDGDIRRIFLTECAVIGVTGGVAGVVLAWVLGRIMNWGANIYIVRQGFRPENFFHIPWWLVGAALGFALAVSIVSGLYPSGRASRIDPARALRHD